MGMDDFDQKILQVLQQNARQTVSNIASQVNLSRSAVSERIKRLEETRVIQGYQVILRQPDPQQIHVWFEVRHMGFCVGIVEQVMTLAGVRECYGISGDLDMLIKAEAASLTKVEQLREKIDAIPAVKQVITHIVLREWRA